MVSKETALQTYAHQEIPFEQLVEEVRPQRSRTVAVFIIRGNYPSMEEIIRTNDRVVISIIEAVLRQADIHFMVVDTHMSTLEGTIGILPQRVLVHSDQMAQARQLLLDAGLEMELPKT